MPKGAHEKNAPIAKSSPWQPFINVIDHPRLHGHVPVFDRHLHGDGRFDFENVLIFCCSEVDGILIQSLPRGSATRLRGRVARIRAERRGDARRFGEKPADVKAQSKGEKPDDEIKVSVEKSKRMRVFEKFARHSVFGGIRRLKIEKESAENDDGDNSPRNVLARRYIH